MSARVVAEVEFYEIDTGLLSKSFCAGVVV